MDEQAGLSPEEFESRLLAIERIANAVRARRSKSSESSATPVIQDEVRVPT